MAKKLTARMLYIFIALFIVTAHAETIELPLDGSGLPYDIRWKTSETHYEDPSITVDVYYGGRIYETNYTFAVIQLSNASQLRTAMPYRYNSGYLMAGAKIAQANNAVFAINGDYYSFKNTGYLVRQGREYRRRVEKLWDVLIIDQNGDFHVLREPTDESLENWLAKHPELEVINSFNFGPAYAENGEWLMDDFSQALNHNKIADYRGCARMAICQLAPLTYLAVACEGETDRGSRGLTLNEFVDCLKEVDAQLPDYQIQVAYNLDGGRSTTMVFCGEKINSTSASSSRDIADILYFASAWQGE